MSDLLITAGVSGFLTLWVGGIRHKEYGSFESWFTGEGLPVFFIIFILAYLILGGIHVIDATPNPNAGSPYEQ